jgi:hypothetical protein
MARKPGRPPIEIDYEAVEKLASIFCTQEEIAAFLGISHSKLTHDEEFMRIHKKGIEQAKMSLRRMQYRLANKSPAMAIFLGKQYLGQRDSDIHLTGDFDGRLKEIASAIRKSDTDTE